MVNIEQVFIFLRRCLKMRQAPQLIKLLMVMSLVLPSLAPAAEAPRCESIFSESEADVSPMSNELFAQIYKDEYNNIETWWQKGAVQLLRGNIKSKVDEVCATTCTEQDITRVVAESIETTLNKIDKVTYQIRRVRGYAILTGITVGTIIGASYLKLNLPVHERFLGDVVSTITTLAIYKLGAPLLDQVQAVAVRGGYRLRHGKDFFRKDAEMPRLRALYQVLREKMTPMEQEESGRISSLQGQLATTFSTAIESSLSGDKAKGGISAGAARIAELAVRMRQSFPEIHFDNPDIMRTVGMTLLQRLEMPDPQDEDSMIPDIAKRQALYKITIQQIAKWDPLYSSSVETKEIYDEGMKAWLGLK